MFRLYDSAAGDFYTPYVYQEFGDAVRSFLTDITRYEIENVEIVDLDDETRAWSYSDLLRCSTFICKSEEVGQSCG